MTAVRSSDSSIDTDDTNEQHLLHLEPIAVDTSPWNVSIALVWLLGVAVVMGSAYHACARERLFSYEVVAKTIADAITPRQFSNNDRTAHDNGSGYIRIDDDDDVNDESHLHSRADYVTFSARHAVAFVIGASSVLVALYYLRDAMIAVRLLFAFAAGIALVQVLLVPLTQAVLPSHWSPWIALCMSSTVALGLTTLWFAQRTNTTSIWLLQDLLSVALCVAVIDTVQLPSLRVGVLLLSAACIYDVFFVYVSPFVFGSNVMVDVATGSDRGSADGIESEKMAGVAPPQSNMIAPMVFVLPLLFTPDNGAALLGLGDVILPGLVVAFCIRFDYCTGHALSHRPAGSSTWSLSYYSVASAAYALGLALANVLSVALRNVVAGQPALLYVVPLLLGAIAFRAHVRSELREMWDGPACLDMQVNGTGDDARESQPLVIAREQERTTTGV